MERKAARGEEYHGNRTPQRLGERRGERGELRSGVARENPRRRPNFGSANAKNTRYLP